MARRQTKTKAQKSREGKAKSKQKAAVTPSGAAADVSMREEELPYTTLSEGVSPPPKPKIYVSQPMKFQAENPDSLESAELDFYGIDHSSGSYEARVFLNNPAANQDTEPDSSNGYVGSIFIFGHGGCYGDVGHCEVKGTRGPFDLRYEHPLTPGFRYIDITEKLKEISRTTDEVIVTVVPVIQAYNELCGDLENIFKFERLTLMTEDE